MNSLEAKWQRITSYPWDLSLCPANCQVRAQPPSWCFSVREMLWTEFWISSSLAQLILASLTSSKGLTGLLSTKGHLILWKNSWGALLNSLSLWSSICPSSSPRSAWENYISQEMHLQSLSQLLLNHWFIKVGKDLQAQPLTHHCQGHN